MLNNLITSLSPLEALCLNVMRLTIAYSKTKKAKSSVDYNVTHQGETLTE